MIPFIASLDRQTFGTIRTGGPSVLTTLLHRGMASRHVAVLWNGFNIQSVVNGTYDIGLIPASFDDTRFYSNGTSSFTGNASMAGALALQNKMSSASSALFDFSISNAQNINTSFTHKHGSKSYRHHLNVSLTSNENKYKYLNSGVELTQEFARFENWNINYGGEYYLSNKWKLTGGFWLQEADRNIPPTKTSIDTSQVQLDENYRGYLGMDYYANNKSKFTIRSAVFDEMIDFRTSSIISIADTRVFNGAFEYAYGNLVTFSTQYRNDRVSATFFPEEFVRNTFSTSIDFRKSINSWEMGMTIRPDIVDGELQPIQLSFRVDKPISKVFAASFRYNRGYTLPSFNDLYWPAGGNENLKTERSHEFDVGVKFEPNKEDGSGIGLNLYYSSIDDWIQWSPVSGIFEPSNQKKVRNLGLELKVESSLQIGRNHVIKYNVLYGFTDSRLVKQYLTNEHEGKRTIFIPAHKISGTIQYLSGDWNLFLNPVYYSRRYDTVDNSSYVPGFFLLDVEITRKLRINKVACLLSIGVENSLNNDYENIRFYPMPLRILSMGIKLKL